MLTADEIDPRFDLNPTLPGVADPYPIYRTVRETDPVHWCQSANLWAVMRYEDAQIILKHPQLSRQAYLDYLEAKNGPQPIIEMQRHELVFMDNPRHEKLRRLIGAAINAQSIHELQGKIDVIVEQSFSSYLSGAQFDLIGNVVSTLPTNVAATWLGVPEEDRERISQWIFPLVSGRGVNRNAETIAAANHAVKELRSYFATLIAQRRTQAANDLISGLLAIQAQDNTLLSEDDLFALIVAVYAGGHTPGVALMSLTLLAMLQFPEQYQQLRANPSLIPTAVEEGLRYTTPTQAPNPMVALENISIAGKTIQKGQPVTVILGSANRDPQIFPDPDKFNLARIPNRHIAFSAGSHYCLGAILTRMQAQSFLSTIIRLPEIQLACDVNDLTWIANDRFRSLATLPVCFLH